LSCLGIEYHYNPILETNIYDAVKPVYLLKLKDGTLATLRIFYDAPTPTYTIKKASIPFDKTLKQSFADSDPF
jgi:hypothetical protein